MHPRRARRSKSVSALDTSSVESVILPEVQITVKTDAEPKGYLRYLKSIADHPAEPTVSTGNRDRSVKLISCDFAKKEISLQLLADILGCKELKWLENDHYGLVAGLLEAALPFSCRFINAAQQLIHDPDGKAKEADFLSNYISIPLDVEPINVEQVLGVKGKLVPVVICEVKLAERGLPCLERQLTQYVNLMLRSSIQRKIVYLAWQSLGFQIGIAEKLSSGKIVMKHEGAIENVNNPELIRDLLIRLNELVLHVLEHEGYLPLHCSGQEPVM